jgi:hypothetical protein
MLLNDSYILTTVRKRTYFSIADKERRKISRMANFEISSLKTFDTDAPDLLLSLQRRLHTIVLLDSIAGCQTRALLGAHINAFTAKDHCMASVVWNMATPASPITIAANIVTKRTLQSSHLLSLHLTCLPL